MGKTKILTSASNSEISYQTRSGRISKPRKELTDQTNEGIARRKSIITIDNRNKELTNKEKGDLLETRTYKALTNMGYVVIRHRDGHYDQDEKQYIGTGDGGIDMVLITEIATIYVQCKNWKDSIGASTMRAFIGALGKYETRNSDLIIGMIVANNFTDTAIRESKLIKKPQIVLTTLDNIERTVIEILIKLETKEQEKTYSTIKIKNAEVIHITKQGTDVIGIGENIEIEIRDEQTN